MRIRITVVNSRNIFIHFEEKIDLDSFQISESLSVLWCMNHTMNSIIATGGKEGCILPEVAFVLHQVDSLHRREEEERAEADARCLRWVLWVTPGRGEGGLRLRTFCSIWAGSCSGVRLKFPVIFNLLISAMMYEVGNLWSSRVEHHSRAAPPSEDSIAYNLKLVSLFTKSL